MSGWLCRAQSPELSGLLVPQAEGSKCPPFHKTGRRGRADVVAVSFFFFFTTDFRLSLPGLIKSTSVAIRVYQHIVSLNRTQI